jgi:pilus assembly protein CpaC
MQARQYIIPGIRALAMSVAMALAQGAGAQGLRAVDGPALQTVNVTIDQARIFELDRAFAEVQIAQPSIADVQPLSDRRLYVQGVARGRTTLTVLDAAGDLIANAVLVVRPDIAELKARLAALVPGGSIDAHTAGGGVVLSGVVPDGPSVERAMSLARAYAGDDVTNLLQVGARQQVALQVRIAEIDRGASKDLGVSLGVSGRDGSFNSGSVPTGTPSTLDLIFSIANEVLLDIRIDALESKGFARTLAEPNLVANSGGEAKFLAGGLVPIPTVNADGDVNTEFRPVGVSLNFRPTVLSGDVISVAVSTEVAAVDGSIEVLGIPGFSVRNATTTVELRDGQSFAIAGLYQEEFSDNIEQVPWLGDLPVLGALFRSTEFQRGESELVVIISASLIAPVDDRESIPTPLDRIRIPNEFELFLLGQTHGGPEGPGFEGAFGYVLR